MIQETTLNHAAFMFNIGCKRNAEMTNLMRCTNNLTTELRAISFLHNHTIITLIQQALQIIVNFYNRLSVFHYQ